MISKLTLKEKKKKGNKNEEKQLHPEISPTKFPEKVN